LRTDALGVLESVTDTTWVVRRRDGTAVDIDVASVVAVRRVPDDPAGRRGPRSALDWTDHDLEAVAWTGWPGLEHERLGEWVLRAAGGFTGRANSVMPLGDPGLPVTEALAHVEEFYRGRGLRPRFQVPLPLAAELDDRLARDGWEVVDTVHVMVADIEPVLTANPAAQDLPAVQVSAAPDAGWLGAYHYRGGSLPDHAISVITAGEGPAFASVRDLDGSVLAIARGAVSSGWVGVTAVEVAEHARRRGLGKHVVRELLAWAQRAGARHAYLQVAAENDPALALYGRMGFGSHHTYHYRLAPVD
jgi:GNAT superfamily N-acetyltransferase